MKRERTKAPKTTLRKYLWLIISAFIILLAVLTNPNKSVHIDKISNKVFSGIENQVDQDMLPYAFLGVALADKLLSNLVSVDNYLIFSLTKVTFKGDTKIIGLGIFGQIILFGNAREAFNNQPLYDDPDNNSNYDDYDKQLLDKKEKELEQMFKDLENAIEDPVKDDE